MERRQRSSARQILTYLRLADKRLGLININSALIKDRITRIVNGLQDESLASRKDARKTREATDPGSSV